jgi:hypothetical protein
MCYQKNNSDLSIELLLAKVLKIFITLVRGVFDLQFDKRKKNKFIF